MIGIYTFIQGLAVSCISYPSDTGEHALEIEFHLDEMMDAEPDKHLLYAEFLTDLNVMKSYGLPISTKIRVRDQVDFVLYTLPLITLIAPCSPLYKSCKPTWQQMPVIHSIIYLTRPSIWNLKMTSEPIM